MSEANAARSPGSPLIYRTGLAAALDARRTLLRKARRRALGVAPLTADSPFLDAARAASYLSRSRRLAAPLGPDAGGPAAYSAEDAVAGKPDEARMAVPFVVSTLRRDRHGDAVVPKGCLGTVQDYLNNPQVFFAHKSEDKPIAHARDPKTGKVELTVEDDRILSTAFFHDKTEEARDVFALVAAGYLRSASIGFLPLLGELIQPASDEPVDAEGNVDFDLGGIVFKEWSLLEWSVVAVPANPDALRAHLHTPKGRGLGDTVRKTLLRTVPARGKAVLGWEPPPAPTKVTEKSDMPLQDLEDDKPEGDAPPDEGDEGDAKGEPQAFLFDPAQFPDEESVKAWLEEKGHNADEVHAGDEADEPWAAIQFDASECEPDTAKREDVEEGVQAVYCVKGDGDDGPEGDEPEDASGMGDDDEDPTYRQAGKSAKGKLAKGKAKASSRLADEPDDEDEGKAGEEPELSDEDPEEPAKDVVKMPYGAEVLNAVHGHLNAASTYCEEAVTLLEQPKVCKFVTKLTGHLASQCDELKAFGEKLYPDHFQSDGVKDPEEDDEETDDLEEGDEESDGMDDDDEDENPKGKNKKRPALADEKSAGMKSADLRDLLAAAEFLEAAAAESGRKSLKVAGKQHASNLRRVATAHATPAKAPVKRAAGKPDAVDARVIARLMASVKATDEAFYQLTGEEF